MARVTEEKIWMKQFPPEERDLEMPRMKIYSYLKEVNKDRLDTTALHYYGKNITYGELIAKIDECANAYTALGVKAGDTVSLLSASTPESIMTVYALNKIGAVVNAIDPRMNVEFIEKMIKDSGSEVLVVINVAFPKVAKIKEAINQKHIIVQSVGTSLPLIKKMLVALKVKTNIDYKDGVIKWADFIKKASEATATEVDYVGDATVAITYTGGTTGFPKGVMLTNDSINSVAFSFKHCGIVYEKGDRFLGIMPIFSSYGLVCGIHMPLTMEIELALIPQFVPAKMAEYIKKYRPNHMISTPAFYEIMMESPLLDGMDLSFLKTMGSGGDTMNEGLETKLIQFMKDHNMRYPLCQGYGMSELSAAASFCVNDRYKRGSVGVPCLTTTVGVFDPITGEELDYNKTGEICMTGPSMMKGYYNNPEETAHVMRLHDDGKVWVHSGDIGYIDEDGFIFIKGRVKRMITRFDGHKVFPVVIEGAINGFETVVNCVVVGVNDRDRTQGQYPMAIVQLAESVIDAQVECRRIFRICNEMLEERGRPVGIIPVDEIPLTGMGKNDFRALEKQYKHFDYKSLIDGTL